MVQLSILLEDGPLLVVNKPAGVPTESASPETDSLVTRAKDYLREKYQKPGNVYLGIPHRLDQPVSGAIVFARNSKCAGRLSEQFAARSVRKIYWAALRNRPEQEQGLLHDWMRKVPRTARAEGVDPNDPDAKEARLKYEILPGEYDGLTVCRVELITGRMHQIRWQLASRGFPILGDELYGGERTEDVPGIALHARELLFLHPIRYDPVSVIAPLPGWWPASVLAAEEKLTQVE